MPGDLRYIDLQLNGYRGVDFNADGLRIQSCHAACKALRADGVAGVLATIITDDLERMAARLARIAEIRRRDPLVARMILGIHVEGPFLDPGPGYAGAHPPESIRPADQDAMKRLVDAAGGLVRIVTLAPEHDPGLGVTRWLAKQKIVVSAGHCNPSLDQLRAAIGAGLSMFTHLGNGCPMFLHRHDNIIQRVLSLADNLWISFIGDGIHIPYRTLANYLRCVPTDRAIIVSDGISAAGLGAGRATIGSQTVEVGDDLVAHSPDGSHFMGATATMRQIAAGLRQEAGLDKATIRRLMHANPSRVLGGPEPL
ncbi:MAG: N-acetylglucosamine-6-phosphate deacetylase [Thermoguttaceae bacterium]